MPQLVHTICDPPECRRAWLSMRRSTRRSNFPRAVRWSPAAQGFVRQRDGLAIPDLRVGITLRRSSFSPSFPPQLDHQIGQARATLALSEAALNQAKAKREIASVTWNRDSNLAGQGWIASQQADTERLNLRAEAAEANIRALQAQLEVLLQLKAYQRVVAPFARRRGAD
jgi:hypothetical protein